MIISGSITLKNVVLQTIFSDRIKISLFLRQKYHDMFNS